MKSEWADNWIIRLFIMDRERGIETSWAYIESRRSTYHVPSQSSWIHREESHWKRIFTRCHSRRTLICLAPSGSRVARRSDEIRSFRPVGRSALRITSSAATYSLANGVRRHRRWTLSAATRNPSDCPASSPQFPDSWGLKLISAGRVTSAPPVRRTSHSHIVPLHPGLPAPDQSSLHRTATQNTLPIWTRSLVQHPAASYVPFGKAGAASVPVRAQYMIRYKYPRFPDPSPRCFWPHSITISYLHTPAVHHPHPALIPSHPRHHVHHQHLHVPQKQVAPRQFLTSSREGDQAAEVLQRIRSDEEKLDTSCPATRISVILFTIKGLSPDFPVSRPCPDGPCRTQFFESSGKRIDLPHEEPEVFSAVLEYLYKGDYSPKLIYDKKRASWLLDDVDGPGSESTIHSNGVGGSVLKDTMIYCSAHRYALPELQRLALKKQGLQSGVQCSTILSSARFAYANTPASDSKLRAHYLALIIRSRNTFKRSGTMQMEMESGGSPLFFDLFVAMVNHLLRQFGSAELCGGAQTLVPGKASPFFKTTMPRSRAM
nr:hypothetical protein CFP56_57867 [Quercus suber]